MAFLLIFWCTTLCGLTTSVDIFETSGGRVNCHRSKIDKNVTLALGHQAGEFYKANSSVSSMPKCVSQCCFMKGCDVAFFSNGACYSVKCRNIESCAPKQNENKRMNVEISYVARPKLEAAASKDSTGETAIKDELIAEFTNESPFAGEETQQFADDDLISDEALRSLYSPHRSWKEWQDLIVAIGCGFVATAVGVVGVILMTRRLVDEDDDFDFFPNDRVELDDMENKHATANNDLPPPISTNSIPESHAVVDRLVSEGTPLVGSKS